MIGANCWNDKPTNPVTQRPNSFVKTIMGKASPTGGVKPMSIAGRLVNERERVLGMTDAERTWRKQWLKDQELAPTEPKKVPEMYKALNNPIRRFYRWPLDKVGEVITPVVGPRCATYIRYVTGKALLLTAGTYWAYYYFKYNQNDWTRKNGIKVLMSRQSVLPGDPGFPRVSDRSQGADYASRGFNKVTMNL